MRGFVLGLSLSVAFMAGSLFGSLGESTADAQSGRQRWEYKLEEPPSGRRYHEGLRSVTAAAGRDGWELIMSEAGLLIFKRPL